MITKNSNKIAPIQQHAYYGDASDGNVVITSSTTLARDFFYKKLEVSAPLKTAGYRICATELVDIITNNAMIHNIGNAGGNASAFGAGLGASGVAGGSLGGSSGGGDGGDGQKGDDGKDIANSFGGDGGPDSSGVGGGGPGEVEEPPASSGGIRAIPMMSTGHLWGLAPSGSIAPNGGAGGAGGTGTTGKGGGGGSGGGPVVISAKKLRIASGSDGVRATGGPGGRGFSFPEQDTGFGGGGGGGGFICIVTSTLIQAPPGQEEIDDTLIQAVGGLGGPPGQRTSGNSGSIFIIDDA